MRFALVTALTLTLLQPGAVAASPSDNNDFAARVLQLTNDERQNAGLPPLSISSELADAAQNYSEVMASSGCFEHTCGPTPNFAERDAAAGYSGWTMIGENIAAGYPTPEAVVSGWMNSPGHRANILASDFTEIGIGVASGGSMGTYWTQEFGSRD